MAASTSPRLPSWALFALRVWPQGNVLAFGIIVFLLANHRMGARSPIIEFWATYAIVSLAITMPLVVLLDFVFVQPPLGRARAALEEGKAVADLPVADTRRVLTMYLRAAGVSFAGWAGPAAMVYPAAARWGPPGVMDTALSVVIIVLCFGFASAVMVFYGVLYFTAHHISPVLLAGGSLEHLKPFFRIRVFHHALLLVLSLGLVMPTGLFALLRLEDPPMVGLVILDVVMLMVAVIQAMGLVTNLIRPAGHLHEMMERVRNGDLEARTRIDNLDTFGQLCSDFNEMVEGLRQRELIRETFGRYVTQQVAEDILAGNVALGGELRTATVLFSDIRGFTSMSERMAPEEVVAFLNRYLDMMVEAVLEHGGTLDKFIGDAVMAVFGIPRSESVEADARAAVDCAMEMSRRLDELNAERAAEGKDPIEIGIGVHTGPLVAGNIGSQKRMEYTVIGDTVNLTSRLEGMTKQLKTRLLVSEATAELLGDAVDTNALDTLPVRGRQAPVRVFSVAPAAS